MARATAAAPAERTRDAERSREAILDAAEALFSERGFDGASLNDIGAAAGLSRGTPSYFFGSKEQLYGAVLERVFSERQEATEAAVAPIHAWCETGKDAKGLRSALTRAMEGYMAFLQGRPAFGRLIAREELAGAQRLGAAHRNSNALERAFAAVRAVRKKRGLRAFAVEEAVLLWVSLTYAPTAHQWTLLVALQRDLTDGPTRRRHITFAADQMMFLLAGTGPTSSRSAGRGT
jgi:TetR/AcrR family transcriptional regulator